MPSAQLHVASCSQGRASIQRTGRTEGRGPICAALEKTLAMLAPDPSCAAALGSPRILSPNSHLYFVNKINKCISSPGWILFVIRVVEGGWGIVWSLQRKIFTTGGQKGKLPREEQTEVYWHKHPIYTWEQSVMATSKVWLELGPL